MTSAVVNHPSLPRDPILPKVSNQQKQATPRLQTLQRRMYSAVVNHPSLQRDPSLPKVSNQPRQAVVNLPRANSSASLPTNESFGSKSTKTSSPTTDDFFTNSPTTDDFQQSKSSKGGKSSKGVKSTETSSKSGKCEFETSQPSLMPSISSQPSNQPSQNSVGIIRAVFSTLVRTINLWHAILSAFDEPEFVNQSELATISPTDGIRRAICATLITAEFVIQPEFAAVSESVGIRSTIEPTPLGRNEGCADGTAVSVGTCEGWLDG